MSSTNNLITVMESVQTYLYQYGGPIFIFLGTIGSIINLIVFTQKTLRRNPCSIYFIAYNLANLLYIYSSLLSLTLDVGYHIDPSSYNLVLCRLRLYITILFNCLSPFYLILALIDRILITSPNALIRQRSTRRLAFVCITLGTLFWVLFHSHALILTFIIQLDPNYFLCYFQLGDYLIFIGYYSLIKEILAFSLMIICGLWSINNIRNIRRIRATLDLSINRMGVEGNTQFTSSKDRQLILMLLLDITMYALFSFVFGIFLMYQQITQNYSKNAERIELKNIIRSICLFIISIPFCTSCYTNLISSKTFRKEVKKVLI